MLEPRPYWTTYALAGHSVPVARLLALRDQVAARGRYLRRAVQDWRQRHVPARCSSAGCDCPCGWCRDGRHGRPPT